MFYLVHFVFLYVLRIFCLLFLQISILNKVLIDYLVYEDLVQLRNTCRFLHDFTRELRMNFLVFPRQRRLMLNKVLSLFIRWARLNPDGSDNLKDRVFTDAMHRPICRYHMRLQCQLPLGQCPDSHDDVVYDRTDLQQTSAYLIYDDFMFMVSDLFGATFIYQFEVYLQALFQAYSKPQLIFQMHDGMSRANETIRERIPAPEVNVLYFRDCLELVLVLEEQYSGCKDIVQHKLFASTGKGRRRNLPEVATNFDTLSNKTAYTDVLQQYGHGIDISPVKHNLGRRMITRSGYEDKVLPVHDPITVKEHIQLVQRQTERAVTFMSRMFS